MTTTTAAVIHEPGGQFTFEQVRLDDLRDNEVLVKIEAVGICHTDSTLQHMLPLPAVMGHEGAGIVQKVGEAVTHVSPGDKVVISYPWCGSCPSCSSHHPALCDLFVPMSMTGARLDGSSTLYLNDKPITSNIFSQSSFAELAITTENNLIKIDDPDIESKTLAALPCGVITGAGSVLNVLNLQEDESIAIFGAGAVGLSAVMAAKYAKAKNIIIIDVVKERLALAKELGATHAINGIDEDVVEQIKAITGRGADYCFETSGNIHAFNNAVAGAKKAGILGIVTAPNFGSTFDFNGANFLFQALTLIGIQMGDSVNREFIPKLLEMNKQGQFPFEKLIKHFDFADINEAFQQSHSGVAIKPVLVMPS